MITHLRVQIADNTYSNPILKGLDENVQSILKKYGGQEGEPVSKSDLTKC